MASLYQHQKFNRIYVYKMYIYYIEHVYGKTKFCYFNAQVQNSTSGSYKKWGSRLSLETSATSYLCSGYWVVALNSYFMSGGQYWPTVSIFMCT